MKETQPHIMEEGTGEMSVLRNTVGARESDSKRFRLSTASLRYNKSENAFKHRTRFV